MMSYLSNVAPHVGAWIEINRLEWVWRSVAVAPHVGAWIEIGQRQKDSDHLESHPTWVRGLK